MFVIELTPHELGTILPVRPQPGARRSGVVGEQAGCLKIAVTAVAVDGKANKALHEVLREALGIKRSQIELIGGETGRQKKFLIRGMSVDDLRRWLEEIGS